MMAKRKDKGIKLSPKYGVNPTIPICAWCGKEKNEIVLMGRLGDGRKGEDFEAPKNVLLDYEPCDECRKKWSLGVCLIAVTETPNAEGQPPMPNGVYPTGSWSVIKREAFERIFEEEAPKTAVCIDAEWYEQMFGSNEKGETE